MLTWIRFILSAVFIGAGLIMIILSVLGVYRFRYVLNRMHSAAMGDTLGILFIVLGLMFANGFNMVLLKLFSIILFMWVASPVSSHLITKLQYTTDEHLAEHCRFVHKDSEQTEEDAHGNL